MRRGFFDEAKASGSPIAQDALAKIGALGSDSGEERAALFYTLIRTATLNGAEPEAYAYRRAPGRPRSD